MEDWSLQAIVRGSSGEFANIKFDHMEMNGQDPFFNASCHDHQQFDAEFLTNFHEIFDVPTTGSSDELKELYKPFYTANNHSLPAQTVFDFQEPENKVMADDHKPAHDSDQSTGTSCVARVTAGNYTPKYKRRKNQHKRVVIQVSAEGLASDMWAWRKYGQKPIKGSPYPRSYYRCSSSKGCLARKQVEQSCTDEGMFIVTYTAEHSHSQPTRRNSLAGTVRQKFPSHKNITNRTKTVIAPEKPEESCSPITPKTLQRPVMSDEFINNNNNVSHARIKEENNAGNSEAQVIKGESHDYCDGSYNDFIMSGDFDFNEDFFSGFEDFDDDYEPQQFPVNNTYILASNEALIIKQFHAKFVHVNIVEDPVKV
ncbi:WRKY transcription factor 22 [Phtheirospermum japonicum]|uniref:WRKY transcription factor 22 n=1 Tax=Phtheirospermum japonicum TaxID=374723 RepID=A0A830BQ26_9LAMI|nr:WRKY transcription factor 22 [Phtheirospermum japonicum]